MDNLERDLSFIFTKSFEKVLQANEEGIINADNLKDQIVKAIGESVDMVTTGETCGGCNGCAR